MADGHIDFDLRGIGTELKERRLCIPIYQRSFAWKTEEVSEFFGDIYGAMTGDTREYFLGTIVLTQEESDRSFVIDGQQRLATAAILLSVVRDEFASRGDHKRSGSVQSDFLSSFDLHTGQDISKLQLNSDDAPFFDSRIIQGDSALAPSKASHKLITAAYEQLTREVQRICGDAGTEWGKRLSDLVAFLRVRAKVMVLVVPTDVDAFRIFETLNDRGADLTIADLLKNYLFGRAGQKLDSVRDGWMQVLGALEIPSENAVFTTFLRHFWSSQYGAVRERDLYASMKERVSSQAQVVDFIGALQKAAVIYSALLSSNNEFWEDYGSNVRSSVESLLRLELEQNRPLLLAVLQHFQNKEVKKLLRSLVSWSVRGLIVGGIGGGTAEKAYCGAAVRIRSGEIKTASEVLDAIGAIVPSDSEFAGAFSIARMPKASIARYMLIALEQGRKGEKEPEFVPNANEEQVNLEHVLPKRASHTDWGSAFSSEERRDYVHRLGNLVLLQKGPNGKIGNKPFSAKRSILKVSGFELTKMAAVKGDWTKATISKRQEELTKIALSVWPR